MRLLIETEGARAPVECGFNDFAVANADTPELVEDVSALEAFEQVYTGGGSAPFVIITRLPDVAEPTTSWGERI